jgi:hypothetical protein
LKYKGYLLIFLGSRVAETRGRPHVIPYPIDRHS